MLAGLSWSSGSGAKVKWQLGDRNELDHFDKGKVRRKRKGGQTRYFLSVHDTDGVAIWRTDEVLFLGSHWSDSAGAVVTFELADAETLLEYRALKSSEEDSTGDTRFLTLVQIGDDDRLVDQKLAGMDTTEVKGGRLARHAGIACRDKAFQEFAWVAQHGKEPIPAMDDKALAEMAATFVREKCRVTSRAQLDHDADAATRYEQLVNRPFIRYWTQHQMGPGDRHH